MFGDQTFAGRSYQEIAREILSLPESRNLLFMDEDGNASDSGCLWEGRLVTTRGELYGIRTEDQKIMADRGDYLVSRICSFASKKGQGISVKCAQAYLREFDSSDRKKDGKTVAFGTVSVMPSDTLPLQPEKISDKHETDDFIHSMRLALFLFQSPGGESRAAKTKKYLEENYTDYETFLVLKKECETFKPLCDYPWLRSVISRHESKFSPDAESVKHWEDNLEYCANEMAATLVNRMIDQSGRVDTAIARISSIVEDDEKLVKMIKRKYQPCEKNFVDLVKENLKSVLLPENRGDFIVCFESLKERDRCSRNTAIKKFESYISEKLSEKDNGDFKQVLHFFKNATDEELDGFFVDAGFRRNYIYSFDLRERAREIIVKFLKREGFTFDN